MTKNGISYRDAGVDIDAGNALVERIKPAAAATQRASRLNRKARARSAVAARIRLHRIPAPPA